MSIVPNSELPPWTPFTEYVRGSPDAKDPRTSCTCWETRTLAAGEEMAVRNAGFVMVTSLQPVISDAAATTDVIAKKTRNAWERLDFACTNAPLLTGTRARCNSSDV